MNGTGRATATRRRIRGHGRRWRPRDISNSGGGRAFTYMGPGAVELGVGMMGQQRMSDGQWLSTWYFGNGFNDDRPMLGPVIEGTQGQPVEVTLHSMMPHTIHFHGLDVDQANDGVPSTSGYVAAHGGHGGAGSGTMGMNFGRVAGYVNLASPFTYRFVAPHAGTYMYHCHVDTVLHVEMGMAGTVIVRPPDGRDNLAWAGGPAFDKEYVWHLHTFDSRWHDERISGPRTVRHRPDHFMINGHDGILAIDDPTAAVVAAPGEAVLIRLTNVGYQPATVELGGLQFEVVASDGRPLPSPIVTTEQLVAPGERYDILLTMPSTDDRTANVSYWDIRLQRVLGGVSTQISNT